jgi:hypothetical protein
MHKKKSTFSKSEAAFFQSIDDELARLQPYADDLLSAPFEDITVDIPDVDLSSIVPPLPTTPPAVSSSAPTTGSKRITIRIPGDVYDAIKREAARRGIRYQTLTNETLRTATSVGW